jgi:hypothetical protein
MAVTRSFNFLSQMRLDVPHFRAIESAICADFDVLAGLSLAGDKALVLRGFVLSGVASGAPAVGLQMATADGIVWNRQATESGTFLWVPTTQPIELLNPATNARVTGGWTVGTINYVGLSFVRLADDSTIDLAQFIDSSTLLETPKLVPLGKTLDYRVHISVTPFTASPDIAPVAVVTLDSNGFISDIEDARNLMYRLGGGGDAPDKYNFFTGWTRKENFGTLDNTIFSGGDKGIWNLKDWMDASMTRTWELGGGEFWYSNTSDRNVNMVTHGAPFGTGEYFTWDLGTQTLAWQGIRFLYENSTSYTIDVADGSASPLLAGEALYVDLDRTGSPGPLTAYKAPLLTLGSGSPFARWVIAWRDSNQIYARGWRYPVGTLFVPATPTSQGVVKISRDYLGVNTPSPSGALDPIAISDRGGFIYAPSGQNGLTILGGTGVSVGTERCLFIDTAGQGPGSCGIEVRNADAHAIEATTFGPAYASAVYAVGASAGTRGVWGRNTAAGVGGHAGVFDSSGSATTVAITSSATGSALDIVSGGTPAPSSATTVTIASGTGAGVRIQGGVTGATPATTGLVIDGLAVPGNAGIVAGIIATALTGTAITGISSFGNGISGTGQTGVSGTGTVRGVSGSGPIGVLGDGTVYGMQGSTSAAGATGVYGVNSAATGNNFGVSGVCTATSGIGIGVDGNGKTYGAKGASTGGTGVYGEGGSYGVYGLGLNDGAPAGKFVGNTAGVTTISTNGVVSFTGPNTSTATGVSNKVTPDNVVKAYGRVSVNTSGVSSIIGGFNVTVGAAPTTQLIVNFIDDMADDTFTVVPVASDWLGSGGIRVGWGLTPGSGASFYLYLYTDVGGSVNWDDGMNRSISFAVYGRQ